jgi:hypothetical protein
MANDPPFATLNHFAADLGIPSESDLLRIGISDDERGHPRPACGVRIALRTHSIADDDQAIAKDDRSLIKKGQRKSGW